MVTDATNDTGSAALDAVGKFNFTADQRGTARLEFGNGADPAAILIAYWQMKQQIQNSMDTNFL